MSGFKDQLLSILGEIKGSGSFVGTGNLPFVFPGLEVGGVGEIGFPVSPLEANEMIKVAHKAPFGKGSETVLDKTVRSAWEIDAGEISFNNKDWGKFTDSIIEQVKSDLGIEGHSITANLYKLLIYEKGDFFLPHKDSEKEKGMFGTLIIGLPSRHTGGELTVSFDGKTETIDFSGPASQYQIRFAAFYADCEHEIKPITSGYRVCLVYNLVQAKGQEKIHIEQLGGYAERLAAILKAYEYDRENPKIVLLGHQYTPANFTIESLKLNDRPKAEALLLAAKKAGFYAKLGLVTSFQAGQLEMEYNSRSRSRNRYYDDDDYDDDELSENGTMGEVYDEYIRVEHWMEEGVPPLRNIKVEEKGLISVVELNEGDPIEKEAEGYTGNAGMEMYYWYHYGAVFLWPKTYQYEMLTDLSPGNKLEWIAWYNKHWDSVEADEKILIKRVAEYGLGEVSVGPQSDYSPLANWLIKLDDENYVNQNGAVFLTKYFRLITAECWVNIFKKYPAGEFGKIFTGAGEMGQSSVVKHLLLVLNELLTADENYRAFVTDQVNQVPAYVEILNLLDKDESGTVKDILHSVLILGKLKSADTTWLKSTTDTFTKVLKREYVNNVLVDVALNSGKGSVLASHILKVCREDLVNRVNNKPMPPVNWSRALPENRDRHKKVWALLTDFLLSPVQQVFDYQKVQAERSEMETAIANVTIDLKTETIRKGSPHTLRLIKTQDAYLRELAKWETDVGLLKKVNEFGKF